MPAISLKNLAVQANALDGLKFQNLPRPALVTIYGTTPTAGGSISYAIDSEDFLDSAELNIEASADVVDIDRDCVLFQEPVPAGKQFLSVENQIANVLVNIEFI